MHAEALGGGVAEFDVAVANGVCPYLNQLGDAALGEMRAVYEELDAGNYEALGAIAERLAMAAQKTPTALDESWKPPARKETQPTEPSTSPKSPRPAESAEPVTLRPPETFVLEIPASQPLAGTSQVLAPKPRVREPKAAPQLPVIVTTHEERMLPNDPPMPDALPAPASKVEIATAISAPEDVVASPEPAGTAAMPSAAEHPILSVLKETITDDLTTEEESEEQYSVETLTVYSRLLQLAAHEATSAAHEEDSALVPGTAIETHAPPDFVDIVAKEQAASNKPSLEEIQAHAVEQPVEHTLAATVVLLAETAASPNSEQRELLDLLEAVSVAFAECYDSPDAPPHITAELTNSLLELLRAVGYEQPGEALEHFVAIRGIGYLFQTLDYLTLEYDNLKHVRPDTPEFRPMATVRNADGDDSRLHIARLIFALISRLRPEPAPTT
jgi:hypothetical protein